jgi:kinesin family protein 20
VEVYNEKVRSQSFPAIRCLTITFPSQIFDLLEGIPSANFKGPAKPAVRASSNATRTSSAIQRSFSQAFGSFGTRMSLAAMANGGNGVIKRQALALKNDLDGGKYVAGMKEIRVRTREEAHAVYKLGQIDRQVFGTGQNQQSSRSHGILTVKIVKIHNGAPTVSSARENGSLANKGWRSAGSRVSTSV